MNEKNIADAGFKQGLGLHRNPVRLFAIAAAVTGACLLAPMAFAAQECDGEKLNDIRGETTLPPHCTFSRAIRITASNTTLDCQGSTFTGSANQKIGLMIDSLGKPLSNVVVKNCGFDNFSSSGIRVTWSEVDSKKGQDHDDIYRRSPTKIVLDNVSVRNSGRVGIYLDDYVSDVTVKNSTIMGSGGTGIYLEHSSRNIRLLGNKLIGNGFDPDGKRKREAVAVDSSADNLIEDNLFQGNAAGGIFLYKNCGEHISSGKQVIRWQHSDRNVIRNNVFEKEPVGVWLASRQKKRFPQLDCGDKPVNDKGEYADFADDNRIENNRFCKTQTDVIDDGRRNQITGSISSCPSASAFKN